MSATDPLLVPVEVQAMVMNCSSMNFIRAQMDYGNLASCQSPAPAPFQEDEVNFATDPANQGVYVRWVLPQALRHAEHGVNGQLDFPFVPNRWLVVRVYRPLSTAVPPPVVVPQVSAWMVQSDALGSASGADFIDPTQAMLTQVQIGQMVPITAGTPWQEPASPPPYFLKAVAEGNTEIAAYQPFHQNVFSIHDTLLTQNVGAGTLSYHVQGWYADPTADVLANWQPGPNGTGFTDELAELGWTASTLIANTNTSIYHGAAFGVPWVPSSPTPPPSPKDGVQPQVAVGNTSVDAVVAFAEAAFSAPHVTPPSGITAQQARDLLEAFLYNVIPLLSEPGGEEQLEQRIRSQWFGSAASGTTWSIVDAPVPPGSATPPEPDAAELAKEVAWLTALNTAQAQFDQVMRSLMAVQRRLFELWWKQQDAEAISDQTGSYPWSTTAGDFTTALDPNAPGGLVSQARGMLTQLTALSTQIPVATATVTLNEAILAFAQAEGLPATRALKAIAQPRFWSASDPVMMISGTAHTMRIDPDCTLACRWPGEVITGLTLSTGAGGTTFTVSTAQMTAYLPAVNFTNLPAVCAALYAEFFLLDPVNAVLAAAAAGQTLTATQLDAVAASMAAPVPVAGLVPAVLAPFPWAQPWQPLYLDWAVTWYPVPFLNASGGANWAFNGSDYDLVPGVTTPVAGALTGRCLLTPKPSFEFKSRIDQYIKDYPGQSATQLAAIEALVQTVDAWDFLSQAFSGLGVQLASWDPVPTLMPPNAALPGGTQGFADLIGAQAQCPPDPQLAQPGRKIPPSTFEGLRGGQFSFSRLTVVDVFGQTLEIVTAQNATQTSILTADGLEVTQPVVQLNTAGLAQLPPRLLQPARLNFQFMPPVSTTNPILGWIVPNHIDGGLAVYGTDGTLYGELSPAVDASANAYVYWWPGPDAPYATLALLLAAQPQFGGFLSALMSAGVAALNDFVRSVDETLWTVDPLGDRSDTFLSVMLGRPLAVVNASVSLELQASAWTDPAWPYTFASPQPAPLFLGYQFPVQFGDLASRQDGLLGYFLDGDYKNFNAVHIEPPGPSDPPLSGYLQQIGPGNWVELGFAATGPGPAHTLTLVMDPRAAVHAQCGILPSKDVTLVRDWVDTALKAMKATFRTGPLLAEVRTVIPEGSTLPVDLLLTLSPAERNGTWLWRQPLTNGTWPSTTLAPVDGNAVFPDTPPILRDGLLQLTGGLGL